MAMSSALMGCVMESEDPLDEASAGGKADNPGAQTAVFLHVISTGDIFDLTSYPVIDVENGGTIQGVLEGLNRLRQMAVPEVYQEGGTLLIPGHGRLADHAEPFINASGIHTLEDMPPLIEERHDGSVLQSVVDGVSRFDEPAEFLRGILLRVHKWRASETQVAGAR